MYFFFINIKIHNITLSYLSWLLAVDTFVTLLNSQIANFSDSQGAGVTEDSCDTCHYKTAHKVTRGNLTSLRQWQGVWDRNGNASEDVPPRTDQDCQIQEYMFSSPVPQDVDSYSSFFLIRTGNIDSSCLVGIHYSSFPFFFGNHIISLSMAPHHSNGILSA